MSVKIREKLKGSGVWWLFIDHRGKRTDKKIGRDKRLAKEVEAEAEAEAEAQAAEADSDGKTEKTES